MTHDQTGGPVQIRARPFSYGPADEEGRLDPYDWPERMFLFQPNIQAICASPAQIVAQVCRALPHEVGHHFGMSEEDLDELGYA